MSNTPRTDALIYRKNTIEMQRHELLDLALALERELAELREELNDRRKFSYAVEQALDGLKGDYVEIIAALRKEWVGLTAEDMADAHNSTSGDVMMRLAGFVRSSAFIISCKYKMPMRNTIILSS